MRPFFYERAESAEEAVRAVGAHADAAAHFMLEYSGFRDTVTGLLKRFKVQTDQAA
jgi:hypothetical protein